MFLSPAAAAIVVAAFAPAAPVAEKPADRPVITGQALPPGQLLQTVRDFARLYGGEPAVKRLDEQLKETLGEKGFTGLDLLRPIAGYATLSPDLEKSWGVVAVPVTDKAAFLDLLGKISCTHAEVNGNPGLYTLRSGPAGERNPITGKEPTVLRMRFHDGYAYFGINAPDVELDAKRLLPVAGFLDPTEIAPVAVRLAFDRLDPAVVKQARDAARRFADMAENGGPVAMTGLGTTVDPLVGLVKTHANKVLDDGERLTVRLFADLASADVGYDVALKAKPGSALAKEIAGFPPVTNRFAGLVPADAAGGFLVSGPMFTAEMRKPIATLATLMPADPVDMAPKPVKPVVEAAIAAVTDAAKAGRLDAGMVLAGPDKNDHFTAVAAVGLNDATKIEAAVRKAVADAGEGGKAFVQLDAATAGGLSVHKLTVGPMLPTEAGRVYGPDAAVVVAFGPKAVYAAVGPNGVAELTRVVGLEPGPAKVVDMSVNPTRVRKLLGTIAPDTNDFEFTRDVLPGVDRLITLQSGTASGGDEFRVKAGMISLFLDLYTMMPTKGG